MDEHGSAQAALEVLPDVARAAGVKEYRPCPLAVAEDEMKRARFAGARLVAFGTPEYPPLLATISDPPPLLWAIGDIALAHRPVIAIVGARNASSLGTRMTTKLATDLSADGYVIASGLARGVDTAAHTAALAGGTIAVMAGGVDVIYPRENTVLGEEIAESGLRLSEQPMGTSPQARHFPRRNRIVSGLARGVVVVEAAAKSGSQITARGALEQGREVLAVPGHPFDARAAGCNMLIRDGAALVRGARDVVEALEAASQPEPAAQMDLLDENDRARPSPEPAQRSPEQVRALHQIILDRLGPSPLGEEQLIRDLDLPAATVTSELVSLELEGRIERQPGGILTLGGV
ncbi:MAG TPA: DNA-protecting protein DprA [Aliiroseovarius sp.]|nr:DNA-protecting protein DprA [Aliiroseovarius sp.]